MTEPKKLACPGCGGHLKEVYAQANYGRVLLLDQCQACGGVWFDKWELYFVADEAIKNLEAMDTGAFAAPVDAHPEKGLCPRCAVRLAIFTDPNLPKDTLIERCPDCNGLWLNRGELGKYAAHRKAFAGRARSVQSAEVDTLKHLQKELKLGDIATPTVTQLAANQAGEPPLDSREVAKDLAFLALQSLVRLVFKI